jgi:hypothetical protein
MLSYYYKVIRKEKKDNSFRFWDLARWLVNNSLQYVTFYRGRRVRDSYKIENTKKRNKQILDDLIELRLIRQAGKSKARKVNADIQIYEYTKGGELLAWLIKGLDPKQRQSAISEIYDLAVKAFSANEDSSPITISRFLRKCKDKVVFDKLIDYIQYLVHSVPDHKFKSTRNVLQYIFDFSFRGSEIRKDLVVLWFETIEQLEPEIKKLMIYRLKLSLESEFENTQESLSREYEELRFELKGNHEKIAIHGYCLNCKRKENLAIHYSQYLKIINNSVIGVQCPQCGLKESVTISNP